MYYFEPVGKLGIKIWLTKHFTRPVVTKRTLHILCWLGFGFSRSEQCCSWTMGEGIIMFFTLKKNTFPSFSYFVLLFCIDFC